MWYNVYDENCAIRKDFIVRNKTDFEKQNGVKWRDVSKIKPSDENVDNSKDISPYAKDRLRTRLKEIEAAKSKSSDEPISLDETKVFKPENSGWHNSPASSKEQYDEDVLKQIRLKAEAQQIVSGAAHKESMLIPSLASLDTKKPEATAINEKLDTEKSEAEPAKNKKAIRPKKKAKKLASRKESEKPPIYIRWWFLLILIVIAFILGIILFSTEVGEPENYKIHEDGQIVSAQVKSPEDVANRLENRFGMTGGEKVSDSDKDIYIETIDNASASDPARWASYYYKAFFSEKKDKSVHYVINKYDKTVTKLKVKDGILSVKQYEYKKGDEKSYKKLSKGKILSEWELDAE